MKIIQVGLGAWGASWLTVVQQSASWELAGVVDVDSAAAERVAKLYGVRAYRDIEHALEDKANFDAVLVIVPPEYHAAVAVPALKAGIPALIEKPLAGNLADALSIIDAADQSGAIAMVSQNYRFKRAPRTVQRLIKEGVIGEVQQIFINYQKNPPFDGFRLTMDEPLIVDAMIHHIDQIRGIAGIEAVSVRANSWNPSWSRFAGNASAVVQIESSSGAKVIYTGSWASQGEQTSWDGDWEIHGAKGSISWKNNTVQIRFQSLFDTVFLAGATEHSGVMHVDLDDLDVEERLGTLAAFSEAVASGIRPETDVRDNILSLQLVVATAESAKKDGEVVRLSSVDELLTSGD
jgi:predicted dehydrogenase